MHRIFLTKNQLNKPKKGVNNLSFVKLLVIAITHKSHMFLVRCKQSSFTVTTVSATETYVQCQITMAIKEESICSNFKKFLWQCIPTVMHPMQYMAWNGMERKEEEEEEEK